MNARACLIVLGSGITTLVLALCVAMLLAGGIIALLLPLVWIRSDLLWELGLGLTMLLHMLVPTTVFWTLRSRPFFPLDAVGLFLAPMTVPFAVAHFAPMAFALCFDVHPTPLVSAMLSGLGCIGVLLGLPISVRLFLAHMRWPSSPSHPV